MGGGAGSKLMGKPSQTGVSLVVPETGEPEGVVDEPESEPETEAPAEEPRIADVRATTVARQVLHQSRFHLGSWAIVTYASDSVKMHRRPCW
jgi:hypothetical protein